jgi:pterin-4a-carbinolamine dehydratase
MSAVPINLLIESGEDWSVSFNLRDEYEEYINLTNFVVAAKMAKNYRKTATKINLNPVITTSIEGEVTLTLNSAQTSALKFGRYVYDVIITAPLNQGGKKKKVVEGIITVQEGVTIL